LTFRARAWTMALTRMVASTPAGGWHPKDTVPANEAEIRVARGYLERGFLDPALKIFVRNAGAVSADDWSRLAERLLDRGRIVDAVSVCELGAVPLPRERVLAAADALLRRRDVDGAIRGYELVGADHERWVQLVDVLTTLPGRARHAIELAERHLGTKRNGEP
jgi:hypothetical protein